MFSLSFSSERLLKMSQEQLMGFYQGDLVKNFGFTNEETIESLIACESELQRARLELPPPASDASEYPTQPFGLFVPPSVEQVIGRRTIETETELIRGRDRRTTLRRNSRMSISIPPDGGPAGFESVDLPLPPSDRLRSVATVDESDRTGKLRNGSGTRSQSLGNRQSSSSAAENRREEYAKTKRQQTPRLNNGSSEQIVASNISMTANGNSAAMSQPAPDPKLGRPKSIHKKDVRTTESDLVAPQHYGASVRL
jgi:hypothetical protein